MNLKRKEPPSLVNSAIREVQQIQRRSVPLKFVENFLMLLESVGMKIVDLVMPNLATGLWMYIANREGIHAYFMV